MHHLAGDFKIGSVRQRKVAIRAPHVLAPVACNEKARNWILASRETRIQCEHAPALFERRLGDRHELLRCGVIEVVQYSDTHDEIDWFECRDFCALQQTTMKLATVSELPLSRSNVLRTHVIADIGNIVGHRAENLRRATTEIEDSHAGERSDALADETRPPALRPHDVLKGSVDEWMRKY